MRNFILRVLGRWKIDILATDSPISSHRLTEIQISLRWQDKRLGLDSLHRCVEVAWIESAYILARSRHHAPLYGS